MAKNKAKIDEVQPENFVTMNVNQGKLFKEEITVLNLQIKVDTTLLRNLDIECIIRDISRKDYYEELVKRDLQNLISKRNHLKDLIEK